MLELNHDVLVCILEELLVQRCLVPLSATCKTLRGAANHILFRRCEVKFNAPLTVKTFPPASLWPYIRYLLLYEEYPELHSVADDSELTGNPTHCNFLVPSVLSYTLQRMPLLSVLSISGPSYIHHRLPWASFKTMLAPPELRELQISRHLLSTAGAQVEELDIIVSPLVSFTYGLDISRGAPRCLPAERDALGILLRKLSRSLYKLNVPLEPAPLEIIQSLQWPQLRHLSLEGEALPRQQAPFIAILGNMPELRCLVLTLTLTPELATPMVWPPGFKVAYPWPSLDDLTISHPHPKDQLYAHLPSTLSRLALCCEPYHFVYLWEDGGAFREQLLSASQALRLLSRCQTSKLSELAIEFRADSKELDFFGLLPRAFPRLASLTINSYRSGEDHAKVPVEKIAHALASLSHLHTLRMYLGFRPALPPYPPSFGKYIGGPRHKDPEEAYLEQVLDRAAQTLANSMGPSFRTIFLLCPFEPTRWHWQQYRVVRAPYGSAAEDNLRGLWATVSYNLPYQRGVLLVRPEGFLD